jgi:hypothetical protein
VKLAEFQDAVKKATADMPPPATLQPQNNLHPDPAALAMQLSLLTDRVAALEAAMIVQQKSGGASGLSQ